MGAGPSPTEGRSEAAAKEIKDIFGELGATWSRTTDPLGPRDPPSRR